MLSLSFAARIHGFACVRNQAFALIAVPILARAGGFGLMKPGRHGL
jgi:hypothetical protein